MFPNDEVSDFFSQGGSLRMLADVDESHLQTLYAYACQSVKQGDIKTAEGLFRALFCLDIWKFDYALSFGLCKQMQGEHKEALIGFTRAATIDVTDPRPAYYAAISYQKLGNADQAKKAFSSAIHWCSNRAEYQEWRRQSEQALNELAGDIPEENME
jgi:secretion system chaperone SscA